MSLNFIAAPPLPLPNPITVNMDLAACLLKTLVVLYRRLPRGNADLAATYHATPLHRAAREGHLELVRLLCFLR